MTVGISLLDKGFRCCDSEGLWRGIMCLNAEEDFFWYSGFSLYEQQMKVQTHLLHANIVLHV